MKYIFKSLLINILLISFSFSSLQAKEKVSLQLHWKHQFQYAGYYMAKEKGFYKDVGLDVKINEYKNGINLLQTVREKRHAFAIDYSNIILNKTGQNNIVLLNAIFQSSPHVLVSLKSSGIKSIQDFKNKNIMIDEGGLNSAAMIAMLASNGVSFNDMNIQTPDFKSDNLLNKSTDIASYYYSNETYFLDKKAIAYDIWDPKDYGFDFYSDILFTSKQELSESPQVVDDFNHATLKGWKYAFLHVDETVDVIRHKYNSQNKTEAALLYEARTLKKLLYIHNKKLGTIDKHKIQRFIDVYSVLGLQKNKISLEDLIYKEPHQFALSEKEKAYLEKKKYITMCIDPAWMPFESLQENKHVGISADYFKLIKEFLHTDIKLIPTRSWNESLTLAQQRKCDILSLVMPTPSKNKYLNFTNPYLQIPLVMATKNDAPFTNDFNQLIGKKLGIPKGYAFVELLREKYPKLTIIEVDNLLDGLDKIVKGDLYGYIGTLATVGYAFQKKFTGELKISAKFDGTWDLGIGVRNDDSVLFDIFKKAVHNIDEKSKQKILNNWLAIKYDKGVDYTLILKMLAIFILILLVILFFFNKQRKLKNELSLQKHIFEALFNGSKDAIAVLDMESNFLDVNPEYLHLTGLTREELLNTSCIALTHTDDVEPSKKAMQEVQEVGFIKNFEKRCVSKDKIIFVNMSMSLLLNPQRILISLRDITSMKKKENDLKLQASTDSLTKLYNRRYFSQVAKQSLELAKRDKSHLSLLMMDLDKFKNVNDTYGHDVGDIVLINFAKTLQEFSRKSDIPCRFGGEEFILLLPQTDIKGAEVIAQKIRLATEKLNIKFANQQNIHFTISIGISQINLAHDINIESVIKRADAALYDAKNSGRNRVCTKL
ncbi:MAG: diguanylate cyclase [Sulfurimonas sp.]